MRFPSLIDRARPCPRARKTVQDLFFTKRSIDLRLARAFFYMEHDLHHLVEGCGSIGELGERLGYSASEARTYARAGHVLVIFPEAAGLFLRGRLTLESAAILQRVLRDVRFVKYDDDWFGWAERETAKALRLRVKRRLEEVRVGAPVVEVTVHLSEKGKGDLDRCRDILSGRAGRAVSESATVETVADDWLDAHDPRRRDAGTRRVGDTAVNRSRHIPEDVKREVRARAKDKCEKEWCDAREGLEFAHIDGHAQGGTREADDLLLLCAPDHRLYDAGWIDAVLCPGGGAPLVFTCKPRRPGFDGKPDAGERRRQTEPPHRRIWRWERLAEDWEYRREIRRRGVP